MPQAPKTSEENIHFHLFYKFFETSPIHGCSYVANRRHPYEGYMWLLLLIVFAGLCINDVTNLTTLYLSTPTAITIDINKNTTMIYNTPAICFDIFRGALQAAIAAYFNEGIFNQTLASIGPSFRLSTMPVDNASWDLVAKATYLMLASYTDYDNQVFNVAMDVTSQRAVKLVTDVYSAQNINFFSLAQEVGKFMCQQMMDTGTCSVVYQTPASQTCVDICGNLSTVVWMGYTTSNYQDDVCMTLDSEVVRIFKGFQDMLLFVQMHVSRASTSPNDWSNLNAIPTQESYGTPEIWLDLRNGDGVVDIHYIDGSYWQSDGTSSFVGIEIISESVTFNRSTTPCFEGSEATCARQCIVDKWRAASGCWSLVGLQIAPTNATPCMTHYAGYVMPPNTSSAFDACLLACDFKHCTSVSYQYRPNSFTAAGVGAAADPIYGTNVSMFPSRFIYPTFMEYPSMDFGSYLALFGGSIGLWLGGSLVAFMHIPIYAVSALIQVYRQRKMKNTMVFGQPRLDKSKLRSGASY